MRRRAFLQWASALAARFNLSRPFLRENPAPGLDERELSLSTSTLKLVLSPQNGCGIIELTNKLNGQRYASPVGVGALYHLVLVEPNGATRETDSSHATLIDKKYDAERIDLVFQHAGEQLTVVCSVRLVPPESRLDWKIKIHNDGPIGLRSLFYPQWIAPARLAGDGKSDRILFPFLDGQEFVAPGEHFTPGQTFRIPYPGQACVQLIAFHDGESGLMQMVRDGEGWVKHFRVVRTEAGFDLSVEHNPVETPGADIDLPYETSMELFHGDWHEPADRYKAWALQQKWAQQTLAERPWPSWLTDGAPILNYSLRGDPYSAEWSMYFPPSNRLINPQFHPTKISALTDAYSAFFNSEIITNPFGWEHIAPWMAGEYFPPVLGEEVWRAAAASLRSHGHRLFMLLSGTRWGVVMDDVGYNKYDEFIKNTASRAAAYGPDGNPMEEWPPWAGSVVLCVGTPFTQESIRDAFLGCVRLGASAVQYDQNHGGMAFPCYNHAHPHPLGYGRWMVERSEELFRSIRAQARELDPEFVLSVEEPCEFFIPYFDLYMGRPYNFFGTGSDPSSHRAAIPLFIYIYHEFQFGYGGSNEIDIAHPYAEAIKIARKFTNGTLLEVDPGKPAFNLDSIPSPTEEMQLARSCVKARKTFANRYLVFGRALRDPETPGRKYQTVRMWRDPHDSRHPLQLPTTEVPLVLESTWSHKGDVAYVFASWQTSEQVVVFRPQSYSTGHSDFKLEVLGGPEEHVLQQDGPLPAEIRITVPPLTAMMVEQSGR